MSAFLYIADKVLLGKKKITQLTRVIDIEQQTQKGFAAAFFQFALPKFWGGYVFYTPISKILPDAMGNDRHS